MARGGELIFQGTEDTSEARRDQSVILYQPPVGRFFSRSAEELQPGGRGKHRHLVQVKGLAKLMSSDR